MSRVRNRPEYRALEMLQQSEEKFKNLADSIADIFFALDTELKFTYWNRASEKLTGISPDNAVGKHLHDVFPNLKDSDIDRLYLEVLEKKQSQSIIVENAIRGQNHIFEISANPSVGGISVFVKDITEQQNMQEALRKSEAILNETSLLARIGGWEHDLVSGNATWTPALHVLLELEAGPAPSLKEHLEFYPPYDRAVLEKAYRNAVETGEAFDIEIQCYTGRNRLIWARIIGRPLMKNGKCIRMLGTFQDITERKQIEEQILKSKKLLQTVIDYSPDKIAVKDALHRYLLVNKSLSSVFNISPKEMIGKFDYDYFPPEQIYGNPEKQIRSIHDDDDMSIKGHIVRGISHAGNKEDNTLQIFDAYRVPLKDSTGNIYGILAYHRDITELYNATEALKESYQKIQRTLDETVEAIASICEIRDPYTAGHQTRVARLACTIAAEMGLPEEFIANIKTGSILHDIGKLYIPTEILTKPGRISDIEFAIIKNHPKVGYEIVSKIEFPGSIAKIVLQHHERLNGSGYPHGCKDGEIITEAKIVAVADVVEAMSSYRPYRPALDKGEALQEIINHKGILYDEKVVDACIKVFVDNKFEFD